MIRYIALTIGSIAYLYLKLSYINAEGITDRISPAYYDLIAPILLAISAGLFITSKSKPAAITGLIGLSIASQDIFSNWFILDLIFQNEKRIMFTIYIILSTIFLFYLAYLLIIPLLNSNNSNEIEIIKFIPSTLIVKVLALIPSIIVFCITIISLTNK
jgi:hypothetical protein